MNQNTIGRDTVARMQERKRIRQKRRRNRRITFGVFMGVLCIFSFWLGRITAPKSKQGGKDGGDLTAGSGKIVTPGSGASTEKDSGIEKDDDITADEMSLYIQSHPEKYPEFLRNFLESTPEAAEFVFYYPEYKDQRAGEVDLSGEYREGEIPLLIQWDMRWGYEVYGDDLMALSGCGPACLSMVYVGLTGDTSMNPGKMAEYASENGYYLEDVGTSWDLMSLGAERLGLSWSNPSLSKNDIFAQLDAGHPLICSMQPGDFTSTGHFIVICGRDGENLLIHDPNSPIRSMKQWPYDQVESQIKNVWAYSKKNADQIGQSVIRVQEYNE